MYDYEELEALTDGYLELDHSKLWIMVRLCDLDRGLRHLSKKQLEAVFLVGLCGFTTRQAGEIVGASHQAVWKRYKRGLEWLVVYLNGDY